MEELLVRIEYWAGATLVGLAVGALLLMGCSLLECSLSLFPSLLVLLTTVCLSFRWTLPADVKRGKHSAWR